MLRMLIVFILTQIDPKYQPYEQSICKKKAFSPAQTDKRLLSYIITMSKQEGKQGNVYVVQPIELSSESDPSELEQMDELDDIKADPLDIEELDKLIETTKLKQQKSVKGDTLKKTAEAKDVKRLEVIDDFIRNFLIRNKMNRTLSVFQQEWYEIVQKGRDTDNTGQIPDAYIENQNLRQEIEGLKGELDKAVIVAEKAKATYDKLLKERDFHKMHHQRVQQEKKKLNGDIEKLKNLHVEYEKKYDELTEKYTHVMKEKMLLKLQRDRLKAKTQIQKTSIPPLNATDPLPQGKITTTTKKLTAFPDDQRPNPFQNQTFEPYPYKQSVLYKTYPGHMMAITRVAFHPKKAIIGTASDDCTWKIWTVPNGELIMSGEGHKDWVSGIAFHPKGLHIVTSSGDSTVKVWDFVNTTCTHTFKDHIQPVWSVAVHDTGDFAATASMDHNSKLFDLNAGKSRHTFRGHVDSVNHASFQPFSNILCTSSADKTISLWDIKTGLCVQTFYGHLNSVNHSEFNVKGDTIASCDADGVVKVWDVRMVKQRTQYDSGPYSANAVTFDKSSTYLAVASDEGVVKLFNDSANKLEHTLKGHEDAVQDVIFDFNTKMIVSCGSDSTFRVWQ